MNYLGDFHIHTVASNHAYSTVREIVNQAKKKELKYIGITDHGPSMLDGPHYYYFSNLGVIPDFIDGVRVYKGMEANIIDSNGNIDYDQDKMFSVDYVIASLHSKISPDSLSIEENNLMIEKVIEHKMVSVIGHPGNPAYPLDYKRFVNACKKNSVAIEINNSSFKIRHGSYENCLKIANECVLQDAKVLLSSDAHIDVAVGGFEQSIEIVQKAGIKNENIINFDEKLIEHYFLRR